MNPTNRELLHELFANGDSDDTLADFTYTPAQLGEFIEPTPKIGRVRKVLREHFFNKNEKGHWVQKDNAEHYMDGSPSSPYWKPSVLPIVVQLLEERHNESYSIATWAREDLGLL